ncbi:MAG: DUF5009 domain-containing protein [Phycisphaerales bacterium]
MTEQTERKRLDSLDAFRGFVIVSMLLVNATWGEDQWGTGVVRSLAMQLAHVPWNDPTQGATFTDLVFPWFLFIMGAAVPLSMRSGRGRGIPPARRILVAARRAVVIYLFGVLLTHATSWLDRPASWTDLLSWNILQLIGAAYFVSVLVGMLPRKAWWAFVIGVLIAKWALMLGIPADWARGVLENGPVPLAPRGDGAPTGFGTFTHFDDVKRLLNREHLSGAETPWARYLVGWLGMAQQWLPAAAIAMAGALAVDTLTDHARAARARAARVAALGAGAIVIAFILSAGYDASGGGLLGPLTVPMSKWFFSPAYCLMASGTAALLLAASFWVIDVRGLSWVARPWRTFGVNALALYIGAEMSYKLAFSRWKLELPSGSGNTLPGAVNAWVAHWLGGLPGSAVISGLAFAVLWIALWWLVCAWLDRNRIYFRV